MSKKLIMAAAAGKNDGLIPISLRNWMIMETNKTYYPSSLKQLSNDSATSSTLIWKQSIIRKTTIVYGILELTLRLPQSYIIQQNLMMVLDHILHIDNFIIHVSKSPPKQQPWDDIKGVSMLSPNASLTIEEPAYLTCLFEPEEKHGQLGRYLEVELMSGWNGSRNVKRDCNDAQANLLNDGRCYYLVAKLLYELFVNEAFPNEGSPLNTVHRATVLTSDVTSEEPAVKKTKSSHEYHYNNSKSYAEGEIDKAEIPFQFQSVIRMQQLGIPTSLCLMAQNLLEASLMKGNCDEYKSLNDVVKDLHLLLLDPDRFLFDTIVKNVEEIRLRYRKDKLYGRDKEEMLITDAFCRVSRGKSEAFFIGGFSGCGKSMLVDTLRARVNVVGGYVLKHKFDTLSEEKSISGVISAVNQLCLMVKARSTPEQLAALADKVRNEFGADVVFLAKIVPNISAVDDEIIDLKSEEGGKEDSGGLGSMNAQSVGFTLLRFLRLVSSKEHPIMLFLDDLQWADDTAFDVLHTFLSDTMGSCMFFVGTYRDNEVGDEHPMFDLMTKLDTSNVRTGRITLAGLEREDLNTMISDGLCMFPRICYALTDIVMQKTNGNPFFVLEFMKSLKDRGMLRFNFRQSRWVWAEYAIRAEDITDNVMHLLHNKICVLCDDVQLLLKVMACFGTCTKESVFDYLSETSEYSSLRVGLMGAIDGGFVEKNFEGHFKFVHDKVREAAYNLIPASDKKKFHYNLGKVLLTSKGKDAGDIVLLIASQIYHGKEYIPTEDKLFTPMLMLYIDAGKMAIDSCRHETAYKYLEAALNLLPDNCWTRWYDVSLRLNFLMANAASATCKYDEAENLLQKILSEGRCTKDKLPSYFLLGQIFQAQGKIIDAYNTCSTILTQLGEIVPDSIAPESNGNMIAETLKIYDQEYGDDWLGKKMEDNNLQNVVKFYAALATCAFFCKESNMVDYIICKMVQVSLRQGACQHTPIALLKLSSIINRDGNNAALAHRLANNAMLISKRFDILPDQMAELNFEFAYAVGYLECFHSGVRRLRGGFESSLSSGHANMGFLCAGLSTIFSIFSGEKNLILLLKEIDYYLHLLKTYKSEMTRKLLLISRETVSMLIDKGEATSLEGEDSSRPEAKTGKHLDLMHVNATIQNYWLGYKERCRHFAAKSLASFPKPGRLYRVVVLFYHGLNLIDHLKKKSNPPRRREVNEIIASLQVTVTHADANFRNKLQLLEAEKYSLDGRYTQALNSYDAAIATARDRKFIHEQGLACEKAASYYKRIRDIPNACRYYHRARECYEQWGSKIKVDEIAREISALDLHHSWTQSQVL